MFNQLRQSRHRFKCVLPLIPLVIAIALLAISFGVIRQELQQYSLLDIWGSLATTPPLFLGLAIALVGTNYWVMTGYDTLAVRYARSPLPYAKTALAATISYAISNTIGATFFSGGALRYRFYKAWGLTSLQIAQVIAFCNLSFWLGLFTMSGVLFLTDTIDIPDALNFPADSLQSLGLAALVTVATYLFFSSLMRRSLRIGFITIPHLSLPMAAAQIVLTCCDWAIAAATIYVLLGPSSLRALPTVIGVYVIAQLAGILSSVPGGIGVFETVMLLLLSPMISSVELFGALIAFRVIHHIMPMLLAVGALIVYEVRQLRNKNT